MKNRPQDDDADSNNYILSKRAKSLNNDAKKMINEIDKIILKENESKDNTSGKK
jgi:hypothetical protein